MIWRFTLIDRNGLKTQIEEPGGWREFSVILRRHKERHGTFREVQGNEFKFHDKAITLLRAENTAYGAQGNYQLLIESRVSSGFWEWYRGVFDFSKFKFINDKDVYVECQVDQLGPIVDMINRFDQKVDITKNIAFDQVTVLEDYPGLNFNLLLPSKAILLRAEAFTGVIPPIAVSSYDILSDSGFTSSPNFQNRGYILPKFADVQKDEIQKFNASYQFDYIKYDGGLDDELNDSEILNNDPDSLIQGSNAFDISTRLKGSLNIKAADAFAGHTLTGKLYVGMKQKAKVDVFAPVQLADISVSFPAAPGVHDYNYPFDFSWSGSLTLARNEKVWIYYIFEIYDLTSGSFASYQSINISHSYESFFKVSSATKSDPTLARSFMINETISRTLESITNKKLKLFSTYFGRPDSKPFSFPGYGCGSLRVLTNGLQIRRTTQADGSQPSFFISMKEAFEALKASDNIGLGMEGDTVRMENWKFFYQNTVVHKCMGIAKISRETVSEEIISSFKVGFDKWEAEDFNGLDEPLTTREYRLDIPSVSNTLEQICKFIVSGYAIEVARRKGGGSEDWRYDNNTFMICLAPDGAAYKVEINNISSPANLVDPPTVYNFRLTPLRNAMRWFDKVIGSYRNVNSGHKIIFTAGEGNYQAAGELTGITCKIEAGVIKENQDINLSIFANQSEALPIMLPERVKYRYSLGTNEYRKIFNQPYGLIQFSSKHDSGFGWIDEMEYFPNEGAADFTLIPKID